jgi:hypothetical protein
LAFWGVVITYYLFGHLYLPNRNTPFWLAVGTALLWLVSSITSQNLARFLASGNYQGLFSILHNRDFWYAYVFAAVGFAVALWQFSRHEPQIVAQIKRERARIRARR